MRPSRLLALVLLLLGSCPDPEQLFVEGRLPDRCDASWPVCTTTAGCVMSASSYLTGKFPGTRRFIVRTDGPRSLSLVLYLKNQAATGQETRIVFYEAGCGTQAVATVSGKDLFKEADADSTFRRQKDVFKKGDHLIEITSDATTEYLLRVEQKEQGTTITEGS